MKLPVILILDDVYFHIAEERDKLCEKLGLFDLNSGRTLDNEGKYLAAVEFQCGQERIGDSIANNVAVALSQIESRWKDSVDERWALVLLDLQFVSGEVGPGPLNLVNNWPTGTDASFGLKILQAMVDTWPDPESEQGNCAIPVVMLSKEERARRGSASNRAGALAYVEKDEIDRALLQELLEEHGLLADEDRLLLGRSLAFLRTLRQARNVGRRGSLNVMILGEPGTGKTKLASYIHRHSPRRGREMQTFLGDLTKRDTLYSDLFGHWIGAYTDARTSVAGKAERAHGSTLFIDEVGNLTSEAQTILLGFARPDENNRNLRRLVRMGIFPPSPPKDVEQARQSIIGEFKSATEEIFVDVFLITATNAPLLDKDYLARGDYRADFLQRLKEEFQAPIILPNLSQRREDILPLFMSFLERETKEIQGEWPKKLDPEVEGRLLTHPFPGNVPELKGLATEVAKASRKWPEVLLRHVRLPSTVAIRPTSVAKPTPPQRFEAEPSVLSMSLEQLCGSMSSIEIPGTRPGLQGALAKLDDAYHQLVLRLLHAALELERSPNRQERSPVLGDLNPTKTVKTLLDRKQMDASQAADRIKSILKGSDIQSPDSPLGKVQTWANELRKRRKLSKLGRGNTSEAASPASSADTARK